MLSSCCYFCMGMCTVSEPGTRRTKSHEEHTINLRPSHWSSDGQPKYVAHTIPDVLLPLCHGSLLSVVESINLSICPQCQIKVGAIDAAALGHSRNRPTATDEKSFLYFGSDFSGWYSFGISIKLLLPDVIF